MKAATQEKTTQETGIPLSATQLRGEMTQADGQPLLPFATHASICNLTDMEWSHEFTYGRFTVQGCKPGEEYRLTTITDRICPMDHGDKNKTDEPIGALHIAHDLVRLINSGAGDNSHMGVFVVEFGKKPSAEKLSEELRKHDSFCRHYVQIANDEYENHRKPQLIPGFARYAARRLKMEVPFLLDVANQIECPACTTKMPGRAAICPNCHFVVNKNRATELGIVEAEKTAKN